MTRAAPTPPSSAAAPSSALERRATLALLGEELLPALRRRAARPLVRAVREALETNDPRRLGRLPERQRRDLLEILERLVARSRRGVAPRGVVGLTAAITSDSLPEPGAGRRLAPPAR